jgi:LacI family transcriptional regulator
LGNKKQNGGRRQHARVTASDVARMAGVSTMTVSRVVNEDSSVRDTTRAAVEKAIKALRYSPNTAARSLASANPIKIGLIYRDPSSTYLSAMLLGIMDQARQSDSQIVITACVSDSDALAIIENMMQDGVDGMLLAPPICDSPAAYKSLKEKGIPAVTIGSRHSDKQISAVSIDDYRAAIVLTQHIISLGHRRIGFAVGSPDQTASRLRLAGFQQAVREAGLEAAEELIVQGDFSYHSGFESAEQMFRLDSVPTAIIASNDDMAAGVIAAANKRGIIVPRELSVCGFDDTMLATTVRPKITTIRQPIAEISNTAIELLEKHIRRRRTGTDDEVEHLELDFELIQRESVAPPLV